MVGLAWSLAAVVVVGGHVFDHVVAGVLVGVVVVGSCGVACVGGGCALRDWWCVVMLL